LFLSQSTVRNHLSTIYRKVGVHSQSELLSRLVGGDVPRREKRLETPTVCP
jgi:DNA-binding NarL/FixJ family response regulator